MLAFYRSALHFFIHEKEAAVKQKGESGISLIDVESAQKSADFESEESI